jgi:transposase
MKLRKVEIERLTDESDAKLLTKKQFSSLVVNIKKEYEVGTIEAVLQVCEERSIDPEDVKNLIDPTVRGMIEEEALALNLLRGSKASLGAFL